MTRITYKRRREQLTDYSKRLSLIKSGKTRLVIRKSNKYINVQFINYETDGDKTVIGFTSKKLNDYGFKGKSNKQSAYLAGFAAGIMASKKGVKNAILDLGLNRSIKNSRIYAGVKGVIDSGIKVPCGTDIMPSDELLKKNELKEAINKIKEQIK